MRQKICDATPVKLILFFECTKFINEEIVEQPFDFVYHIHTSSCLYNKYIYIWFDVHDVVPLHLLCTLVSDGVILKEHFIEEVFEM